MLVYRFRTIAHRCSHAIWMCYRRIFHRARRLELEQTLPKIQALTDAASISQVDELMPLMMNLDFRDPYEHTLAAQAWVVFLRLTNLHHIERWMSRDAYYDWYDSMYLSDIKHVHLVRDGIPKFHRIHALARIQYPDFFENNHYRAHAVYVFLCLLYKKYSARQYITAEDFEILNDGLLREDDLNVAYFREVFCHFDRAFILWLMDGLLFVDPDPDSKPRGLYHIVFRELLQKLVRLHMRPRSEEKPSIVFYIDHPVEVPFRMPVQIWEQLMELAVTLHIPSSLIIDTLLSYPEENTSLPMIGMIAYIYEWARSECVSCDRPYASMAAALQESILDAFSDFSTQKISIYAYHYHHHRSACWLYIRATLPPDDPRVRDTQYLVGYYFGHGLVGERINEHEVIVDVTRHMIFLGRDVFEHYKAYVEKCNSGSSFHSYFWFLVLNRCDAIPNLRTFNNHPIFQEYLDLQPKTLHAWFLQYTLTSTELEWITRALQAPLEHDHILFERMALYDKFFDLYAQLHDISAITNELDTDIAAFHTVRISLYCAVLCNAIKHSKNKPTFIYTSQLRKCMRHLGVLGCRMHEHIEKMLSVLHALHRDDLFVQQCTRILHALVGPQVFDPVFLSLSGKHIQGAIDTILEIRHASTATELSVFD